MPCSQFVWVAAARLDQGLEHEDLVFFPIERSHNVLECKPPWVSLT